MRQLEGRIPYFLGLLAEDGAEHPCFRCEVCLALRGQLSDEDVVRLDLGSDPYDTIFIQLLEHIAREVRDVSCDLFRSELGVSCLALVLLDVERCQDVVHEKSLVEDDSVLVVVTFPGHESDEEVLSERDLAHACGRTVSYDFACLEVLAVSDDRSLVDACTLVGALELEHLVLVDCSVIVSCDPDVVGVNEGYCTGVLAEHYSTGVTCSLVLDTCAYIRRLGNEQRNSLSLHVGSHQGTVSVVVLEERDHSCSDRYYLLRGYVHVVDFCLRNHGDLTLDSSYGYLVVYEVALCVERLVGLCYDHEVLISSGKVLNVSRDDALFLVDLAVRSLDESVLVDDSVSCERTDKSDVRTFRCLDRAHSSVVGVMYVSDLHAGSFSRKSARSESRQSSLVSKFCQRVVLVHKLRQLG